MRPSTTGLEGTCASQFLLKLYASQARVCVVCKSIDQLILEVTFFQDRVFTPPATYAQFAASGYGKSFGDQWLYRLLKSVLAAACKSNHTHTLTHTYTTDAITTILHTITLLCRAELMNQSMHARTHTHLR